MRASLLSLCVTGLIATTAYAADWPAFRGPEGTGVAHGETGLAVEWGPETNIKWKSPLPADGNSSPIVVAGRVLVTCAENDGRQRHLFCFDRQTGEQSWVQTVEYDAPETTHKTNPHCASTPASDGEKVVVWEGSAGLHCYDLDGNRIWSRDLGKFEHIWGYASSPVIHDGKVIQLCGPGERTFLTALDLETGETIWETPEPGGSNEESYYVGTWSTPLLIDVDGNTQILCSLPTRAAAYAPGNGQLMWFIGGMSSNRGDLAYASPVPGGGLIVAAGGFGGPAMAFKLGGRGDMTAAHRLWHTGWDQRNPQRIGSGMIVDGHLYLANADDRGSLQCINVETGEQTWEVPRTTAGPHWGSIVFADGRLYVTGQRGITRVFASNPEQYELLAENDLEDSSNSTPAISDGEIFLRTFGHVWCVAGRE